MKVLLEKLRKEALEKYIPVMRPRTAELLSVEVSRLSPKRCLEIGTCIGLGAINMLLSGAERVTTIEIDEERFLSAKENIRAFGLSDRCECILADCKEILPLMEDNRYDFIVLDGPKSYYPDAYSYLKKMLLPGGEIFIDDTLFHGMTKGEDMPERKHRTNVLAMRKFLEAARRDKDFSCREYEMEDGVMILSYGKNDSDKQFV